MGALDRLAGRLAALEDAVDSLSSTPQLASSSIVNGAIDQTEIRDTGQVDGQGMPLVSEVVVSRIGQQADGSNTIQVFDGPKPPTPVAPLVTAGPGFVSVEWTGEFVDRIEPYADHDYVAVHVGTAPGFSPDASTLRATMRSTAGESVVVKLGTGRYYVSLVAVAQSGRWSDPAPYSQGENGEASAIDVVARAAAADAKAKAEAAQAAADAASATANAASQAATDAQNTATTALTAADGKSKMWFSTSAPGAGQGADGDVWWQRDPATGLVAHVFERRSGAWAERTLNNTVIDNLSAGQLTTGTLSAATTITTGDPNGMHTVLGQSSLQVWRPDGDGVPQPTISVGGADRDVLMVTDPSTGATLAGFDGDGGGSAQSFITNTLSIGGSDIGYQYEPEDILFQFPRGRIAGYAMKVDGSKAGTTPLGVCEVAATCYSYRMYRARFEGNFYTDTVGAFRLFLYYTTNGSTPTINSPQLVMGVYPTANVAGQRRASIEGYFFVSGLYDQPSQVRVLLAMQRLTGGGQVWHHSDGGSTPGRFTIEDLGPQSGITADLWDDGAVSTGGGTPASGGTTVPPTTKQTYTKTYQASWSRNWRNGSAVDSEIRQGSYSARYYGAVGFPSQVQTDLANSSLQKLELYLYANHWYNNSGGTAVIGAHTSGSAPGSFPSGSNTFNATWTTKTGGKWITIPQSWYQYWVSGNNKGFTFGDGASTSSSYYGRFNGYGMSSPPLLRATYQK